MLIIVVPEGKYKPFHCSEGFLISMGANAQKMNSDQIVHFRKAEGRLRFEEQFHRKYYFEKDYAP